MVEQTQDDADMMVVVDADTRDKQPDWSQTSARIVDTEQGVDAAVGDMLDLKPSVVVLDGDDRLVSRMITGWRRRRKPGGWTPRFLPLRTGRFQTIASAVGAPRPGLLLTRRIDRLVETRSLEEHRLRPLRVTTSVEPHALFGFSFGAGLLFSLFEAMQRGEGQGLAGVGASLGQLARDLVSGGGGLEPQSARTSIDYSPWGETIGYMLATTLEETWMGVSGGAAGEGRWLASESGGDLLKEIAGGRALPRFLRRGGEPFERIHIDWSGGFALDGELYDAREPHAVQVAPGPVETFVSV